MYWSPYVPVAQRQEQAARKMNSLRKKGIDIQPVRIEGRKIATTFWGKAWCDHIESFSDFDNRLPRGRTYVRNGSVCHLAIEKEKVVAYVSGSSIYDVHIHVDKLPSQKWNEIKEQSAGGIGSVLELLRGDLSDDVMKLVTDPQNGLFPLPKEISFKCDCPDWAGMCKHIAAVLYGVGSRLDKDPSLLFRLRGVNHEDLISNVKFSTFEQKKPSKTKKLAASEMGDVFGIDLETEEPQPKTKKSSPKKEKAKKPDTKKKKEKETPISKVTKQPSARSKTSAKPRKTTKKTK